MIILNPRNFVIFIGSVDNFFVTVDGKSLKLMEVAVVKQHEKEFRITPMLQTKNVSFSIYTIIMEKTLRKTFFRLQVRSQ